MKMKPTQQPRRQSHLSGLDGLRALACLAVFGVHFHQKTGVGGRFGAFDLARLLENGNTGVAVLFILSGFLLSLPFWSRLPDGPAGSSLWAYLLKRAARIVPAYYLCLLGLVVLHGHWLSPRGMTETVLHFLFVHNYTEFSFYSINDPFWTIAVQAQFYLLLPLIFLLLRPFRSRPNTAFVITLVTCTGLFGLHVWLMTTTRSVIDWPFASRLVSRNGVVLSHSVLAHLPHFILGVSAGHVYTALNRTVAETRREGGKIVFDTVWWFAVLVVVAILATPLDDVLSVTHGRYNFPFVPVLIAVMIVCTPFSKSPQYLLDSGPLRWLGVISYGVYVYHLPCQNLVVRTMGWVGLSPSGYWAVFGFVSLSLSIVVAWVSYLLVERPVLRAVQARLRQRL